MFFKRIVCILIIFALCLANITSAFATDCPEIVKTVIRSGYNKVKNLIETGCDVDTVCRDCYISYGIMKQFPIPGGTALMQAAALNDTKIMKLLLDEGADPDILAGESNALSIAANLGHYDAVKVLIDGGADVDLVTNHKEFTSLHYFAESLMYEYKNNYKHIFRDFLMKLDKRERERHLKEYEEELQNKSNGIKEERKFDHKIIKLLLANSIGINMQDTEGYTPLMLLISNMNPVDNEAVRMFLDSGADADIQNNNRQSAQSIAKAYGYKTTIKILEEAK